MNTVRRAPLALLLLAAACAITEPSGRSADAQDLARNRQRWQSARLHDYEYDYQLLCFCAQETTEAVRIVVRGDVVTSVTRKRDGLPAESRFAPWPRVDELFADVERRLAEPVARLDVTYDATYGYPTSIVVDVATLTADDESNQIARNLRPLN